ncbi:hypothetical protein QZH41_002382 [Actinostola sp. cb2023]|nr:hypothetical protein QZH41_002382 [Actinostola sp. cb2023]
MNGEICIGEIIVPKTYAKLVLTKNNEIQKVEFVVQGRKIPLDEIRKRTLQGQNKFTRQHPDCYYNDMSRIDIVKRLTDLNEFDDGDGLDKMREKLKTLERTRHLMIWHDHSTVANHGHLLFLATVAYDPAFDLTSQEYKEKTGKDIDIQEEVESPQVYIIARCSDTDVEQLAYSETRCECLKKLSASIDIQPGIPISDKMRFCKGDGPAVELESGQQRGGHYYCSGCAIHQDRTYELDHAFRCPPVTFKERQEFVLQGPKYVPDTTTPLQEITIPSEGLHVQLSDSEDMPLTRRDTKDMAYLLKVKGISAVYYDGALDDLEKEHNSRAWLDGKAIVMCATKAFGMGIDKNDVRFVIHHTIPESMEDYFQEADITDFGMGFEVPGST